MLFIIIGVVFSLIIFISLFGDYKGKELEEWKKKWKKLFDTDYY